MKFKFTPESPPSNLVISGGGINGIRCLGALDYLYHNKYLEKIAKYAGTSAGSILILFLSIGYTPEEIFKIGLGIDFKHLFSSDLSIDNLVLNHGIDNGQAIQNLFEKIMKHKHISPDITFQELYQKTGKEITFFATNITTYQHEYFNYHHTPNFNVLKALRMSITIPFIFSPVEHENQFYIDGAFSNNYPIDFFKEELDVTLGIATTNKRNDTTSHNQELTTSFLGYLGQIVNCTTAINTYQNINKYSDNTILLENQVASENLTINHQVKINLYRSGQKDIVTLLS